MKLVKLLSIAVVVALACTGQDAQAQDQGWYWQRYWTGCGYTYRKVYYPVQQKVEGKVENTTTVVNNLIGIPVPVQYTQPIAQQGTTVYGYSSVAETYGSVDLGLLYNQAARLTDQAQQLAGQAATDFHALVQAEGQNRAEVAKILAQGQAARDALLAAKGPPPQFLQKTFTFRVTQDAKGEMKIERVEAPGPDFSLSTSPGPSKVGAMDISTVIKNRCLSCHGNEKASGGLNFLQPISDQQQASVLERITTDNAEKRMPKGGARLTVAEMNAFFQAMGGASTAGK